MPTVDFKFTPKDKVQTPLGETGVIDTCSIGTGGGEKRYYVLLAGGKGAWFDEDQLTLFTG